MPRLRVLAGTSFDDLRVITDSVNTNTPVSVSSRRFEGQLVAHIKDLNGTHSEYFDREDKADITWSICVQGRFLSPVSANNVLFGNVFARPLQLPWGSSIALKFMKYIDPALEHDLTSSSKPWALSPLIATMPHFAHSRGKNHPFPSPVSLSDDTSQLHLTIADGDSPSSSASSSGSSSPRQRSSSDSSSSSTQRSKQPSVATSQSFNFANARQRRAYFSDSSNANGIIFGPQDSISVDFCYGFIEFDPTLTLRLPGGICFDLMRYWDGQPVRFVCCERATPQDAEPWGEIFWCLVIEPCKD